MLNATRISQDATGVSNGEEHVKAMRTDLDLNLERSRSRSQIHPQPNSQK
jgi:hypothetical protein